MKRVGGYKDKYPHAEDIDLFLRLAEVGKLHNLRKIMLKYRLHYESVGHSHAFEQQQNAKNQPNKNPNFTA